jgi:hypothetical protein
MVDFAFWEQSNFIERFRYELFLAPINVPIVILSLLILSIYECLLNAVNKKCLKFDLVTKNKHIDYK